MTLDLTNSNLLGEDFAMFVISKNNRVRKRPVIKDIIPTELPSGDRLEDEFGGSARYPAFDEMNNFYKEGTDANIFSVGDYDYETTPYGYTLNAEGDYEDADGDYDYENAEGDEEYSNFRIFGIGKLSEKQKERRKKRKERRDIRKKRRKAAREERRKLPFGKRFLNIFSKFNPLVAVPRSAALVGMRFNFFGISSRLYPALLTEEELKSKNFDLENAKKAKEALEKVKKRWLLLGGATPNLESAIRKGHEKPIFNTKKARERKAKEQKKGFDGEYYSVTGEPISSTAVLAYVSTGLTILATLIGIIKSVGAKKNPYAEGSPEAAKYDAKNAGIDDTAPEPNEDEMAKLQRLAKEDLDKGLGLDEGGDIETKGTILGIPKTAFWIGAGVLALVGGLLIYKAIKKK